jgi:hypothetical protein
MINLGAIFHQFFEPGVAGIFRKLLKIIFFGNFLVFLRKITFLIIF